MHREVEGALKPMRALLCLLIELEEALLVKGGCKPANVEAEILMRYWGGAEEIVERQRAEERRN